LAGLDDVDTTHGLKMTDTADFKDDQVYKMPIRRASDAMKTPLSMAKDQSQSMQEFALKYGEKDDYLNANRMINLDVVRQKNYRAIVAKANQNAFVRRSSSAYRMSLDETNNFNKTERSHRQGQTGGFTPRATGGFANATTPSTLPVLKNFARSLSKTNTIGDKSTQPTDTLRLLAGGLSKKGTQENFSKTGTQDKFNTTAEKTLSDLAKTIGQKKTHFATTAK